MGPQYSIESVKIVVLQTLHVTLYVCVCTVLLASCARTLCYRVSAYITVNWGLPFSSGAVQETCWASAARIWGLCWLLVIV